MKSLVDSNIWFALAVRDHELHPSAGQWFASLVKPDAAVFCRSTQQSFLRHLTLAELFKPYGAKPFTNRTAWEHYERFTSHPRIGFVQEPGSVDAIWKKLCSEPRPSPKLWMDAYLAAFAISGGYRLVTADKGFKQFKNLDLLLLTK